MKTETMTSADRQLVEAFDRALIRPTQMKVRAAKLRNTVADHRAHLSEEGTEAMLDMACVLEDGADTILDILRACTVAGEKTGTSDAPVARAIRSLVLDLVKQAGPKEIR